MRYGKRACRPRWLALLLALCIAFSLALGCTACGAGGSGMSAATMFLRKAEGTVTVSDAAGTETAPAENIGLYSGYTIGTEAESYAWIDLDKVKLAKLNENSAVEITKDGKNLSIDVKEGSLFFNVTEPLAGDETMEIRTSSMLVGIRGTCGWMSKNTVGLLEGTVTVTAGDETATVNAGEQVWFTQEGTLEVRELNYESIPPFVARELLDDGALQQSVLEASGLRIPTTYEELLNVWEQEHPEWEIAHSEEIDFERDGSPEFLVVYVTETGNGEPAIGINIYRSGTEGIRRLTSRSTSTSAVEELRCSLMESNGRYFVCICVKGNYSYVQYWADYIGSLAGRDGGARDWGVVDSFTGFAEFDPNHPGRVSAVPHDEHGFTITGSIGGSDREDIDAQGRYTLVRELYVQSFGA